MAFLRELEGVPRFTALFNAKMHGRCRWEICVNVKAAFRKELLVHRYFVYVIILWLMVQSYYECIRHWRCVSLVYLFSCFVATLSVNKNVHVYIFLKSFWKLCKLIFCCKIKDNSSLIYISVLSHSFVVFAKCHPAYWVLEILQNGTSARLIWWIKDFHCAATHCRANGRWTSGV